jgi:hypothetical protein
MAYKHTELNVRNTCDNNVAENRNTESHLQILDYFAKQHSQNIQVEQRHQIH